MRVVVVGLLLACAASSVLCDVEPECVDLGLQVDTGICKGTTLAAGKTCNAGFGTAALPAGTAQDHATFVKIQFDGQTEDWCKEKVKSRCDVVRGKPKEGFCTEASKEACDPLWVMGPYYASQPCTTVKECEVVTICCDYLMQRSYLDMCTDVDATWVDRIKASLDCSDASDCWRPGGAASGATSATVASSLIASILSSSVALLVAHGLLFITAAPM